MTGMRQKLVDDSHMSVDKRLDKKVTLNVGGIRHGTWISTLERTPGTRLALLAHLQEADESYDTETGEYFFDRHPAAFNSVMHYMRTEEIHVDSNICGNIMKGEFEFWGLEEQDIEACCWGTYSKWTEHKNTLEDLDENFAYENDDAWGEKQTAYRKWAARIWQFLEDPASSRAAKAYAIISMGFVTLSIGIFCLETHTLFQVDRHTGISMSKLVNTTTDFSCCCKNKVSYPNKYDPITHPAISIIDYICVAYFTLELLTRFFFAPNKIAFWKSVLNLIDLICLLPHYTTIIMKAAFPGSSDGYAVFKVIMMLRIVRVLRIFKLMKHYSAFKILVYTLKVSTKELALMVVFLFTGVLLFASIIHYAEKENFPNIPIGFWWALVTMTTVGYGDVYPKSEYGYIIGVFCVLCGVLTIAFTVPIVVNNFTVYYSHAQSRINLPTKKKRVKIKKRDDRKTPSPTGKESGGDFTDLHLQKQLNIREPEKTSKRPQSIENNLDQPQTKSHQQSKQIQRTTHGHPGRTRYAPGKPGGVQKIPVSTAKDIPGDPENSPSTDSGYIGSKHEAETRALLNDLADANRKLADERKRQEVLIKQKREQRKQQHKDEEKASDTKSKENAAYEADTKATEINENPEKPKAEKKKLEKRLDKKKKDKDKDKEIDKSKDRKNESDA